MSKSAVTGNKVLSIKRDLKAQLKNYQKAQKLLFKLSQTDINVEDVDTDASSTKIWKSIDANFSKTMPFIEDTIDRWNERT